MLHKLAMSISNEFPVTAIISILDRQFFINQDGCPAILRFTNLLVLFSFISFSIVRCNPISMLNYLRIEITIHLFNYNFQFLSFIPHLYIKYLIIAYSQQKQMDSYMYLTEAQDNTTACNADISSLLKEMASTMIDVEKNQVEGLKNQEMKYLQTCAGIIDQMGKQLQFARQRYLQVDKNNLIQDKRLVLAEQIKLFRDSCQQIKKEISDTKKTLRSVEMENKILQIQNQGLMHAVQKKDQQNKMERHNIFNIQKEQKEEQKHLSLLLKTMPMKGFTNPENQHHELMKKQKHSQTNVKMESEKVLKRRKTSYLSRRNRKSEDIDFFD